MGLFQLLLMQLWKKKVNNTSHLRMAFLKVSLILT